MKIMLQELRSSSSAKVVFAFAFVCSIIAVVIIETHRYREERLSMHKIAIAYAYQIRNSIYQSLSATYPLAALVRSENGKVSTFDDLAQEMLVYYPHITAIQLAQNGVVSHIVPLKGNEKAIGHNLLSDMHRNKEAFLAKKTGQLTLAGPFELVQGGLGVVGRLPIFLKDEYQKDVFWGFSIVLIRVPEVFNQIKLHTLEEQNIAYQLTRIHPDTDKKQTIVASKRPIISNPIEVEVKVPNANWTFSVSPSTSWRNYFMLFIHGMGGFVLSFFAAVFTIYFKRRGHHQKLEFMAYHDTLTHLPNRVLLMDRFKMASMHSKYTNHLMAVCFIDLDHFKEVNDHYSHEAGDCVLIEVTQRILKCIRESDTLSRHGGDEFILLLTEIKEVKIVQEIVDRIVEVLAQPYHLDKNTAICLSASIGVTLRGDMQDIESLIQQADHAMYQAKSQGRNRCVFYDL